MLNLLTLKRMTMSPRSSPKSIREVAKEKVKGILKEHYPEPLPKDIKQRLVEIVRKAERELVKKPRGKKI